MSWQRELGVVRAEPIGGGSINAAFRAELADGRVVFVKTHAAPPPGMYAAEARGLAWLVGPVRVPQVIAVSETFIALEWLELGGRSSAEALGRGLAQLHALGAPCFGLDHANFLATLPQDNTPAPDIATLYLERRLAPLFAQLGMQRELDRLRVRRDLFGPAEPPARLHGDLWSGNVSACAGAPVIFDPAVYGGHREIDLAMLQLFAPPDARMLAAYAEVAPLADGWEQRVELWQLYPLAAHAVMFGGGYTSQTRAALGRVVG